MKGAESNIFYILAGCNVCVLILALLFDATPLDDETDAGEIEINLMSKGKETYLNKNLNLSDRSLDTGNLSSNSSV
jgi:hypothetical protein